MIYSDIVKDITRSNLKNPVNAGLNGAPYFVEWAQNTRNHQVLWWKWGVLNTILNILR